MLSTLSSIRKPTFNCCPTDCCSEGCACPMNCCASPTSIDSCPFRLDIVKPRPNATKNELQIHSIAIPSEIANSEWLDASLPTVQIFQEQMGTTKLARGPISSYYTITESGQSGLEHATNELHRMFLHATQYVLDHEDELAPLFHFPKSLWPKIKASWAKNQDDVVSARFDFALTDEGIKTYEYNADSASCLFECGYSQDAWSDAVGLSGRSNSSTLFAQLVDAWKAKKVDGVVHFLCDDDLEERYHSLYMKSAAEAAGLECYLIVGVDTISQDKVDGLFRDAEKRVIKNVWKTWSWETVLKQYKSSETENRLKRRQSGSTLCRKVKLEDGAQSTIVQSHVQVMDVLLHPSVRVFEPLWTLLPSSKAILPVLSMLYPDHPYLLRSSFDERDIENFSGGYCAKPVMGRTGANVSIFDADGKLISSTGGAWDKDNILFQELALLPKYDDKYVQVNCWAINGHYGGTILRVDASNIIGGSSGMYAMRVIPDDE